jgi:hypothetical protein
MTTNNQLLLNQIERAIRAGRVVTVGDRTIRYCKKDQEFGDDESGYFQALASGVFPRMPVFSRDLTKPERYTWGYFVPLDDLEVTLSSEIQKMSQQERSALCAELAFASAMASDRAERAHERDRENQDFDTSPAL